MPPTPLTDPYLVYLDTTVLVDLASPRSYRGSAARRLLKLFQKHKSSGQLVVITSVWALTEAQGVLYGNILDGLGLPMLPHNKSLRNTMPPLTAELKKASTMLNNLLAHLGKTTTFRIESQGTDPVGLWQLIRRFGEESAIWPPDSAHLALALELGCSMLVTDDNDFMNKIEYCTTTLIEPHRQSILLNPPSFQALGVMPTTSSWLGTSSRRLSAGLALNALGFM